ncbi:hypothetical protein V6Z12_A10G055500 [Gossypium hirsutum]
MEWDVDVAWWSDVRRAWWLPPTALYCFKNALLLLNVNEIC